MNFVYRSSKVIDGFSTCFRQHGAHGTHCKFLHGYGISIKFFFEAPLDNRNWTIDFGCFKRAKNKIDGMNPKEWLTWLLDHTVIIAQDDPELEIFKEMDRRGIIQLRILPQTGCEKFAEYIFKKVSEFLKSEFGNRVTLTKVSVREHDKNEASCERSINE